MNSKGHIVTADGFEFFHGVDGTLYVAPANSPLDVWGYRMGARFECMPRGDGHAQYLRNVWNVEIDAARAARS